MTDAARWERVKAVFQEALGRDASARAAYLDDTCHGDCALRAEVESLLAAHDEAGSFADGSPLDGLPASAVESIGDGLCTGARLGPYEILSKLGEGGMGEVYRARDNRLGRDVAIKILPPELATDPQRRARFGREASAIARLTHPNVCTLYDFSSEDGRDFLVMEYVDGLTLATRLARSGEKGLPLDEAIAIAIGLANALAFAHQHGVVHRDVKPANVMVTRSGVKLLDFGLSRLRVPEDVASEPTATIVSDTRVLVGTLPYMAPEQLDGRADARTDIFAFGAVLYEMLSGRRSFDGESSASIISAVLNDQPPPLNERRPLTPPALERVVRTCLEKNPDDRFQSAHDLRLQLQWIARDLQAGLFPRALTVPRRWAVAAIAASLALAAGIAIGSWRGAKGPVVGTTPVRFTITAPDGQLFVDPALSPDGRNLVFVAGDDTGERSLWLRALDSEVARKLPGTKGAGSYGRYPFWSPDGRTVAFFTDGKLKRVDIGARRSGAWNDWGGRLLRESVDRSGSDASSCYALRGRPVQRRGLGVRSPSLDSRAPDHASAGGRLSDLVAGRAPDRVCLQHRVGRREEPSSLTRGRKHVAEDVLYGTIYSGSARLVVRWTSAFPDAGQTWPE